MFRRNIAEHIEKVLGMFPVVLINGARQVGKTTLVQELVNGNKWHYVSFDSSATRKQAEKDPDGFIRESPKPLIIDEVQKVGSIFSAIKIAVDTSRKNGQFLLTGSADPMLLPSVSDSLAGRMAIINLMPLSQGEIEGTKEDFIDRMFEGERPIKPRKAISRNELYQKIIMGGYPGLQGSSEEKRLLWFNNYVDEVVLKDIRDIAEPEMWLEIPSLLQIAASRSADLFNVSGVAREAKMVGKTVERYLALLEIVFILYRVLPWSNNLTTRFIKSPKLYLLDTGLLSHLINMDLKRAQTESIVGRALENFVVSELKKQITWSKTRPTLYHFRSATGVEVDSVLERRGGDIVAIEVKSNGFVTDHDQKGLELLRDKTGDRFKRGIVLYTGPDVVPIGDKLFAVPIDALWE